MKYYLILTCLLIAGMAKGQQNPEPRDEVGIFAIDTSNFVFWIRATPFDTVKVVVLTYHDGPTAMQKKAWATRVFDLESGPDSIGQRKWRITGYLDTDRKTPITFPLIWETREFKW